MRESGVNVRASGSTSGTILGAQTMGQQGTLVGGPTAANGFTWYNVNWDAGADGWSADTYIEVAPATPSSPGDISSPGPVIAAPTTFSWGAVNGAEGYGLYIRDVNTGVNVFNNDGGIKTQTSYNVSPSIFTAGHAYRWVTSSYNGTTEGILQSSYRYFQVASAAPDLTASNISVNTTSVTPGSTINVSYTLQNLGGAAPSSQTKLALVNPSNVTQVLASTTYTEAAIGANSSASRSGSLTLPANAASGTYQVRLYLDNLNSIGQTVIGNDILAGPNVTVATPKPNLVPQNVSLGATSVQAGGSLTVNWRMSNTGGGNAAATVTGIRLGTSSTTHPGTGGNLNASFPTGAIPAGSYLDQNTTVTIPGNTPAGTYYIWVIADNSVPATLDQTDVNDDWAVSGSFTVASSGTTYDRSAAVAYARAYANYVGTDGYFWINGSTASFFGSGSAVPVGQPNEAGGIGDDCAHFVSQCIGSEPHKAGGGLNVPSTATGYGNPSAQGLTNWLLGTCAQTVSAISSLSPGDVIAYDWDANGRIDHVAFYLGNGTVAAHSKSVIDYQWDQYRATEPDMVARFIHINDSATPIGKPNLVPTNVVVSPLSVSAGATLTVAWRMNNAGTAAAASTVTGVRIGSSSTVHPGISGNLNPSVATSQIGAGAYLDQTTSVTIPATTAPGTYYIWVIADNSNPVTLDQTTQADDWAVSASFTVTSTNAPAYNTAFFSDDQLRDVASMSVSDVRSFLSNHGSYFANPVQDVDGVTIDLPSVIEDAALQHNINPQVLLVTLQKESQGVTSNTRPSATRMGLLMGAGAASTARAQVAYAAQLFDSYQNALDTTGSTVSGWRVGVAKTTQDGIAVTPATKAIAGQFTYTPLVGAQWGGNDPNYGGVYLFYSYWASFGFGNVVIPPKPNLAPSNVTVGSGSVQAGGNLSVSWRMSNTGGGNAAATPTGIRFGTSNTTHPASSGISNVATGSISAGSYLDQSATITVPAGTAPGVYYVWVIADNSDPVTLDQTTQADDWAVSGSFTVTTQNTAPGTPTNVTPANGESGVSLAPTLVASAFTDPDVGDTQLAAQWQVISTIDGSVLLDTGEDTIDKTSWTLPAGPLAYSTKYRWRVRFEDNHGNWSDYSALTTFQTMSGDTVPPTITAAAHAYQTSPNELVFDFSENVSAALSSANLLVSTTPGGTPVSVAGHSVSGNEIRFTLPTSLADGNYRAVLPAGSVSDMVGNTLAGDYTFDFFVLAGDANRDRVVNFADLLAVARNYGQTGATWAQGDFTGDGVVNFTDLLIVARAYNTTLPVPAPAPVMTLAAPAGSSAAAPAVLKEDTPTVFSTRRVIPPPPPVTAKPKPKAVARPRVR